jgi:aspartate/methionine/tyrosine aminotransferase
MFFPLGIPAQAGQAKSAAINATIGQLTDGAGHAMPLPTMAKRLPHFNLDEATLYTPQGGNKALRTAWKNKLDACGPGPKSLPFCTVGLTHGLSLLADLFIDENTDVLLPQPGWGNYDLIFGVRGGGRIQRYPVFEGGTFCAQSMERALAKIKDTGVVVLNFPGNPTGYTPTPEQLRPWLDAIRNSPKPIVVICDDAYTGFVYESGCIERSPFHDLRDVDPERVLLTKVDGATKELCFFGGRVGFVTFGADGKAGDALEAKIKGMTRASVSTAPAISQALVLEALKDPDLPQQKADLFSVCQARYRILKESLAAAGIPASPFNSGFFAMVPVAGDPEALRLRLLKQGIGIIALPGHGAIRIAYSSTSEDDIPAMVAAIAAQLKVSA